MTTRTFTIVGLGLAFVIVGLLSPFASTSPDGLSFVAQTMGFVDEERMSVTGSWPLAGYAVRGIEDTRLSGGLAGLLGCVVCFAMVGAVGRLSSRHQA